LQVVVSPLFGKLNLSKRRLLYLFRESVRQDDQDRAVEESEQPIAVAPELDPDFPDVFRANQFLEILCGHHVDSFDQTQYPCDFLRVLVTQVIEELFDWATASGSSVECDGPHSTS
jgi:hypothetical protein